MQPLKLDNDNRHSWHLISQLQYDIDLFPFPRYWQQQSDKSSSKIEFILVSNIFVCPNFTWGLFQLLEGGQCYGLICHYPILWAKVDFISASSFFFLKYVTFSKFHVPFCTKWFSIFLPPVTSIWLSPLIYFASDVDINLRFHELFPRPVSLPHSAWILQIIIKHS